MNKNYYISCIAPDKCVVIVDEPGVGSKQISKQMTYEACESFIEKEKTTAKAIRANKKLRMIYIVSLVLGLILSILIFGVLNN